MHLTTQDCCGVVDVRLSISEILFPANAHMHLDHVLPALPGSAKSNFCRYVCALRRHRSLFVLLGVVAAAIAQVAVRYQNLTPYLAYCPQEGLVSGETVDRRKAKER
jgi:hypothetical protein